MSYFGASDEVNKELNQINKHECFSERLVLVLVLILVLQKLASEVS